MLNVSSLSLLRGLNEGLNLVGGRGGVGGEESFVTIFSKRQNMVPNFPGSYTNSLRLFKWPKGQNCKTSSAKTKKATAYGAGLLFFILYGRTLKVKSSKQLKITSLASLDMKVRSLIWSQTFSNTSTAQASVTRRAKPAVSQKPILHQKQQHTDTIKLTAFLKEHTVLKSLLCSQFPMRIVFYCLTVSLTRCQISWLNSWVSHSWKNQNIWFISSWNCIWPLDSLGFHHIIQALHTI